MRSVGVSEVLPLGGTVKCCKGLRFVRRYDNGRTEN